MKTVGSRKNVPTSPAHAVQRAERIIAEANRLAPHPKARGFVVKAKTWSDYTAWKQSQKNPRFL